jgi:multidrug efflux pump subunit AcrA (membrane-fusion protein)
VQGEASFSTTSLRDERGDISVESDIWRVLVQSERLSDFSRAWITLLCQSATGVRRGALLLGPPDRGPYDLLARFPEAAAARDDGFLAECANVLNVAIEKRRPAIEGGSEATRIGYPLLFADLLHGAVLVEIAEREAAAARRIVRHLQWSAAGIEAFLGRDAYRQNITAVDKAQFLIGTIDALAAEEHGLDAARVLANCAARRLACDGVAIGQCRRKRSRLVAVSQNATVDPRSALARAIEAAQDEAIDQEAALVSPRAGGPTLVAASAHDRLARSFGGARLLTVPLFMNDTVVGAMTLRRNGEPFTQNDVDLADALGAAAAPLLMEKWRQDRSIPVLAWERAVGVLKKFVGPRHFTLKAVTVALIASVTYLALATDVYRARARAQIQGETRRLVSAPFDGFIRAQFVRAGDVVKADTLLAELQYNDLELERLRQIARKRQYQTELAKALAKPDLAAVNIARAQIEQTDAEIDLSDQMIARARLRAPFDAVVVSGDLSQSVGKPVSRGDTLFELAPLDRYRMTAIVPETDIGFVKVGQRGELLLSALPDRTYPVEISSITTVAQAESGVNGFEVIGTIEAKDQTLRPGMEGVAKIDVGRRNLAWIWIHPIVDWMRIKIWALVP